MGFNLPILNRRRRYLTSAFTPASLFTAGEQGYWLDPSDFSTMFQDAAGATPVTATGQSVRLMLDKSKGLVLGSEQIVNGGFATDSDWSKINGATISGGVANLFNAAAQSAITQTRNFTLGRTYLVSLTWTGTITAGMGAYGSGDVRFITNSSAGSFTGYVTLSAGTGATFWVQAPINVAATVDNISVRELAGNHFTQANTANAPILGREPFGGRRNLLTFTEQFDNAAWVLQGAGTGVAPTRTLGAGTSPAGVTACRLQFSLGGGTTTSDQSIFRQSATVPSGAGVFSVWLRSTDGTSSYVMQLTDPSGNGQNITVTGTWQRFQVTGTSPGTAINYQLRLRGGQTPANSNTADVLFSEPQVETGSTATAYQRVVTAFDVTQAGVADCYYLSFDGTDDWLQSAATINPGAVDKAQVFAGVRRLTNAAYAVIAEVSAAYDANNGVFTIGNTSAWLFGSKGNLSALVNAASTPPITSVLTGLGDISGDSTILRVNGTQQASSAADQGTGNYLTYTHYIGRRNGASFPFNGRIYQMITRYGANLTAGQITQTENFVAGETGVYTLDQLNRFATLDASGVSYNAYGAADANSNNYLVPKTVLAADGTPYSVL